MSQKLTPWYPGYIKPVRRGVYLMRFSVHMGPAFQRWTGKYWSLLAWTPEEAATARGRSDFQQLYWRGLAEKP